jgi:hypothetical protein
MYPSPEEGYACQVEINISAYRSGYPHLINAKRDINNYFSLIDCHLFRLHRNYTHSVDKIFLQTEYTIVWVFM